MIKFSDKKLPIIEEAFQAIEKKSAEEAITQYVANTVKNYFRQQKIVELKETLKDVISLDEEATKQLEETLRQSAQVTSIEFDPIN